MGDPQRDTRDSVRRWLSTGQGERPQRKLNLPTLGLGPLTSSLQPPDCEKIAFCHSSFLSFKPPFWYFVMEPKLNNNPTTANHSLSQEPLSLCPPAFHHLYSWNHHFLLGLLPTATSLGSLLFSFPPLQSHLFYNF